MSADWVALAKKGDLDALLGLAYEELEDPDETEAADALAFKYLTVAADFGHAEAEDRIADLFESSSLRYDDDQFVAGETHLELGVAYLLGTDGLAKDLVKGRAHLEQANDCAFPASIEGGDELLAELRAKLSGPALAAFNEIYPKS